MHPVLMKTFGGLSRAYYFRQFLFGLLFPALIVFMFQGSGDARPMGASLIVMLIVNTLLYPYARFVYESVVGFILGDNVFILPALIMLFVKLITMALCWSFAIFIAPVGLAYLYYRHSKDAREA